MPDLRYLFSSDQEVDATAAPVSKDLQDYIPQAVQLEPAAATLLFILNNVGTATAEIKKSTTTAGRGAIKIQPGKTGRYEPAWPLKLLDHVLTCPTGADILIRVSRGINR